MRFLLFPLLFLCVSVPAGAVHPCALEPSAPQCQYLLTNTKGRLFVYETDGMRCSLYINENGMAAGAGGASCIPWAKAKEFRILRVIETQEEDK